MGKQQSTLQFTTTSCMRQFDIYTSEYAQLMYYLKQSSLLKSTVFQCI